MSQQLLEQFETEVDAKVGRLGVLDLPLATVLTGLYRDINCFATGDIGGRNPALPHLAMTTASTLSSLGQLLERCPRDRVQRDSVRAWNACLKADPERKQFDWLRAYGQFCDLMPKVRRGYYHVDGDADAGFTLSISEEFARFEERDIILNELARERLSDTPPPVADGDCRRLADTFGTLDAQFLSTVMIPYFEYELGALTEPVAISQEGFEAAVGATLDDYRRFRAAWAALGFVFQAVHRHVMNRLLLGPAMETNRMWAVYHGTHSVLLPRRFAFDILEKTSGLADQLFGRLLSFFSIDASSSRPFRHLGDGHFPPVLLIRDVLMFNPLTTAIMMNVHNLLFALNKLDARRFDKVSSHFEPHLLTEAQDVFRQVTGLHVAANREWRASGLRGEIDLLVYHPSENTALHLQAKGSLPPDGARAVGALERRVEEGVEQLERFRKLSQADQDRILSDSLGMAVRNVVLVDVLLTRSNFGTAVSWKRLGDVTPVNLPLLRALMKRNRAAGAWRLARFRDDAEALMIGLVALAQPTWVPSSLPLGKTSIDCPWLDFNDNSLNAARRVLWSD